MSEKKTRCILGIDPGTNIMGYGIIQTQGSNMSIVCSGVIRLNKIESHQLKLKMIFERLQGLIGKYRPQEVAIEAPFHGKNVQSMLKLGRAQGVAMAVAILDDLPIFEYAPKKIKMAITGNGNASKEQVAGMLEHLLSYKNKDHPLDATDGLATAVCHYLQANSLTKMTARYKDWPDYLKANPGKAAGSLGAS